MHDKFGCTDEDTAIAKTLMYDIIIFKWLSPYISLMAIDLFPFMWIFSFLYYQKDFYQL
jgi:hypothetical protein